MNREDEILKKIKEVSDDLHGLGWFLAFYLTVITSLIIFLLNR